MIKIPAVYTRALKLAQQSDNHFIELARLLLQIQEDHPKMLRGWVKRSGLSRRKAYYLIEIAKAFMPFKLPDDRLVAIGWTKLGLLAAHVDADNVHELLTLAETSTAQELREVLRDGESAGQTRCVLLYLSLGDYALFDKALRRNGASKSGRGLVDKEKALMRIIVEALDVEL